MMKLQGGFTCRDFAQSNVISTRVRTADENGARRRSYRIEEAGGDQERPRTQASLWLPGEPDDEQERSVGTSTNGWPPGS